MEAGKNSMPTSMGLDKDENANIPDDDASYATARWDLFQSPLSDNDDEPFDESTCYIVTIKTLKVLAYLFTFALVLGCAVISKLSLLIMTSRIGREATTTFCNSTAPTLDDGLNDPDIPAEPIIDIDFEAISLPVSEEEKIYWTWIIFFAFILPELFTFGRSLRFCIFKGQQSPTLFQFLVPFSAETLHTFGLGLFVYVCLPALDAVKGAIVTTTVCLIPAILSFLSGFSGSDWNIYRGFDIVAIFLQFTALGLWAVFPERSATNLWLLPIAVLLISFGWWQNYTSKNSQFGFIRQIADLKQKLTKSGYKTYLFISMWKILLFFLTMIIGHAINGGDVGNLFGKLGDAFAFRTNGTTTLDSEDDFNGFEFNLGEPNRSFLWTHPLFYHVLAGALCYISAKYACKICIQQFSFALPLTLTVPVTVLTLFLLQDDDTCFLNSPFYGNLKYNVPEGKGQAFSKHHVWVLIFWLLSQIWITIHIWLPKRERLAPTERIFIIPMYNAFLIDQSLVLNRRKHNLLDQDYSSQAARKAKKAAAAAGVSGEQEPSMEGSFEIPDNIPRIKACATMWHETREEMIEIMKSIYRMDEDQCARRNAVEHFEMDMYEIGYYEYETHIFFDDAFQLQDRNDPNSPMVINDFVKTFVSVVDEAALHIHEGFISIRPPQKFPTPYGGRLVWTLPGKTKMIAHLKDKSKIRHKKRWSQCMYMYYLLGYQLMEKPIKPERKEVIAAHTFLLALDGDVDFQPRSVELLVDLMKKNERLGAACGRIHPTGGGPMVWYQKFEYATGHWLQKATEHMIGCVLCSPGCFSLFRGRALMNDAVMGRYTTISSEPRHYVQYDQGEDRWLCTLLVQQGYRVDYSAASDAYTHAPEDFNEFYNQRRRWVPSTTANIMDLLTDYRKTIRVNPDISIFYIAYQMLLMIGTILGPGTIFLMLTGACITLFKVGDWLSFALNLAPIVGYAIVCYFCKNDMQLKVAQVLSVMYALLMVGVLVGIAVQISNEGILAPSSLFLLIIAGSFIFAALLHPLEFDCLISGIVYYITIPSMYLLLIIFSVFNINNVSWGTREGPKIKSKAELEAEAKEMEELKKKKEAGGILGFLRESTNNTQGSVEFGCAGLFKLMCCTHEKEESARISATLEDVAKKLDAIEKKIGTGNDPPLSPNPGAAGLRKTVQFSAAAHSLGASITEEDEEKLETITVPVPTQTPTVAGTLRKNSRDDMRNPHWITDSCLLRRKIDNLPDEEILFWNELIEKYLFPLDADKKKEKDAADALLALRNASVFYFFLANGMFVLLIFFLTLQKESVSVKWPLGNNDLDLEPIGFVFVLFFAVILFIQFVAMLFHRFGTLAHILSSTDLNFTKPCRKQHDIDTIKKQAAVAKDGIGLIKALQKMKSLEEEAAAKGKKKPSTKEKNRMSIAQLQRRTIMHGAKNFENLDERFEKNFQNLQNLPQNRQSTILGAVGGEKPSKARNTFLALNNRMSRIHMRQSRMGSTVSAMNAMNPEAAVAGAASGPDEPAPRMQRNGSSSSRKMPGTRSRDNDDGVETVNNVLLRRNAPTAAAGAGAGPVFAVAPEPGFPDPNTRLQVPGREGHTHENQGFVQDIEKEDI